MGKDKKSEGKKAKAAEKKLKQEKKADKKAKTKNAKAEGSDAEDVDIDELLKEYERKQEQFLKITETVDEIPPKPRSSSTLLASPSNSNQILLFGGEYFNGSLATFFNDLHVYHIDKDEWRSVTSPNAPLPRSGHAWCRGGNQGNYVYLFGGEFSSPKQGTFHHYHDFWRLDTVSKEWLQLEPKGKTPSSRSGHRMTYFKRYIVLFGGFQDTANQTKYLADLWLYDTQTFVWHQPNLPSAQLKPDARSSFTFLPHEQGAVLYGGYSRVKATTATSNLSKKSGKGGGGGGPQRNILKPMVHQDCFFLRIAAPAADAPANSPPSVRWERRKRPANAPAPARAGSTMTYHRGRGILFGGVHDVEESEEGLESEFFNGLFAWNVERNRFFPLALRRARQTKKAPAEIKGATGRRGRAAANEEELLKQLAALGAGKSVEEADEMDIDTKLEEEEEQKPAKEMTVTMEYPHPRFNAQLAVQDDVLYIYGGTFEKGDREFTFDDLHAIDLSKMDGCKEIFNRPAEDWMVGYTLFTYTQIQ
jgi:N-acetylneuraminic acid mutarotase